MIPFLLYSIKLSCCLTLFCVGYKLLLSHETFFHFNRKILLTGMLTCMLLPLINIRTEAAGIIQLPMIQLEKIMTEEESFSTFTAYNEIDHSSIPADIPIPPISFSHLLVFIFVTGCCIHFCLLIRSHISLFLLMRSGRKIKRGDCTIVLFDRPFTPFNYGHYIMLSEKDYHEHPDTILTHELAHYWFSHSFDIALIEFLTFLQWYNPVVRLLKKEIQKVHEFQADAEVLKKGIDATTYQLLLVQKTVDSRVYRFTNRFNHSKLKTRFTMMSTKNSNPWARLKFLWLLPAVALMMYAFARPIINRPVEQMNRNKDTPLVSSNPIYEQQFLEDERSEYFIELDESESSIEGEQSGFLINKPDFVALFVEADEMDATTISQLSVGLMRKLVDDYPNKKPVLIFMSQNKDTELYTVKIKASSDTPMGIIDDVKQIFGDIYVDKVEYEML